MNASAPVTSKSTSPLTDLRNYDYRSFIASGNLTSGNKDMLICIIIMCLVIRRKEIMLNQSCCYMYMVRLRILILWERGQAAWLPWSLSVTVSVMVIACLSRSLRVCHCLCHGHCVSVTVFACLSRSLSWSLRVCHGLCVSVTVSVMVIACLSRSLRVCHGLCHGHCVSVTVFACLSRSLSWSLRVCHGFCVSVTVCVSVP